MMQFLRCKQYHMYNREYNNSDLGNHATDTTNFLYLQEEEQREEIQMLTEIKILTKEKNWAR